MKVKQLIAKLKKMPQNLEVFTSAHDHSEWEHAATTFGVSHYKKTDFDLDLLDLNCIELERFESNPKEWVTITG